MKPNGPERKHQEATYGPLSKFGYKDFISMFKAEKFDPDQWAELFKKSGARFAGPVAEHHDGFSMWDTQHSECGTRRKWDPNATWSASWPRLSRPKE